MSNKRSKSKKYETAVLPPGIMERALPDKVYSQQPRFIDAKTFFTSVFGWARRAELEEEPYEANSMARDQWLRQYVLKEPHLVGVFNSAITIDKNRGWSITGGRNQVIRCTAMMHSAEDGMGWRYYFGRGAMGFYGTDMGSVTELGREGRGGPLRALYNVDSARCQLTGRRKDPLQYKPKSGGEFNWTPDDFFRVSSMPSDDESYHGLGFCAVSRCLELAKLMVAVYEHDKEQLGAKAPRGLLLLKGIRQDQWEGAMEGREEKLRSKEWEYYGGVAVLANSGPDEIDAKLVGLSQLPDKFDLEKFTNLLMYGYALAFGYDPSEFWPVQFGALGRGTETEVQHRKATGKGGMDHVSSYQEMLQKELSESVQFEFEQRDTEGEILDSALADSVAGWIARLYEAGRQQGEPLLDREQALSLLVEKGIIPEEWSFVEEDVEASDVEGPERWLRMERQRALTLPRVRKAVEAWPGEPIVKYTYDPQRYPLGRERVLWAQGADALRRHSWPTAVARQTETGEVLYAEGEVMITEGDVNRAIDDAGKRVGPEMVDLLTAPEMTQEQMDALEERSKPLWKRLLGRER